MHKQRNQFPRTLASLRRLDGMPAELREELTRAEGDLARTEHPLTELEQRGGRVGALVRMELGGYFAEHAHRPRPVVQPTATDYGRQVPDPEVQARLSALPSVAELLRSVERLGVA